MPFSAWAAGVVGKAAVDFELLTVLPNRRKPKAATAKSTDGMRSGNPVSEKQSRELACHESGKGGFLDFPNGAPLPFGRGQRQWTAIVLRQGAAAAAYGIKAAFCRELRHQP